MSWYEDHGEFDLANQIFVTNKIELMHELELLSDNDLLLFVMSLLTVYKDNTFPKSVLGWYVKNGFITPKQKRGLIRYTYYTVFPLERYMDRNLR